MAVGNSAIESWNGSAWSSASSTDANLNGVSCSGPSACMAVGYITVGTSCPPKEPACGQVYQVTAIESWNGSVWSGVSSPNAPSQLANDLTGVSCTSPSECTAVGYADSYGSGYQTLIESWNGSAWSIVPSPNTSDIQTNYLSGVSCNSSTACTAVGDFVGDSMYDQTLIESWNGSVWSIKPSPNTSSNQNSSLSGVSCTSPSACTAVGSYSPGNPDLTLIESWNGSTWSIVPSPNSSSNAQYNLLRGVSCTGPTACTAVGTSAPLPLTDNAQPLIESSTSINNGKPPVITSSDQASFTTGSSGTFTVTSTGSPTAFVSESGALPNGVSFVDNGDGTATLSGTPATGSAVSYPIGITAGNGVSPDATQSFTLTVQGPPTTSILIPSNGATLSGTAAVLDASASNATSVEFLLFGGSFGFNAPVLCTGTASAYGWLCVWNTTTVPNGSYVLVSLASGPGGSAASTGVSITLNNPPPTTSVLIPSNGATVSGTAAVLDASASNATSVEFLLFGGTYGYSAHLLGTATSSPYGWIDIWDTTTVPNGSYVLVSLASGPGGTTASSGVSITVSN